MSTVQRKSSRRSCPVKRDVELVVVRDSKSFRDLFPEVEVRLKSCLSASEETDSDNSSSEYKPLSKMKKYPSRSQIETVAATSSSDEETLLQSKMKKYPSRKRVPLKSSNVADAAAKKSTPRASGKENSSKGSVKRAESSKKVTFVNSAQKSESSEDEEEEDTLLKLKEQKGSSELGNHSNTKTTDDAKTYPVRKRKTSDNSHTGSHLSTSNATKKNKKSTKSPKIEEPEEEEGNILFDGIVDESTEMERESEGEFTRVSTHDNIELDEPTHVSEGGECGDNKSELITNFDETEDKNSERPRVLTANATDGQAIFGFVTPKRRGALAKIAQDVRDSAKASAKKSRKSISKSGTKTPVSTSKGGKTSASKTTDSKNRNKVTLLRTLAANDSDDDEEEDEDELSESEESDDESTPGKSVPSKKDEQDLLDQYFEVHGKATSKQTTSDKTLAKLTNPKMGQQELRQHLEEAQATHIKEIVKLHSCHQKHYKTWMLNLFSGFNVLVYGFGSKHMLLEKFRKTMLRDEHHVVVNGFFPSIQIKQVS